MKKRIILASNSPRRRELLSGLDIDFETRVIDGIEESYPIGLKSADVPEYIAREKAEAYNVASNEILVTADTVVELGGKIFGKPHDEEEAKRMLHELSGKTHHVITGVCLATSEDKRSFSVSTSVTFKDFTNDEIDYYVSHYKPLDKAGAYGIQEWIGYIGCKGLEGSYYNVMGLPVQRIYEELKKMGQ